MKKFKFLRYLIPFILAAGLVWGAASDYKVDNLGRIFGYDLIVKGPWVDARAYTTLQLANTAAYNAGKTLLIAQNYTLTANTTLTAAVKVIKGGSFTKASTYTLTINGPPDIGFYQVFYGFSAGDVTFGVGTVKEVYAEWFGAKSGDITVDSSIGINAALVAGPGVQLLGSEGPGAVVGTYTGLKYYIADTIHIPAFKFLRGVSWNLTTIVANAVGITMIDGIAGIGATWWTAPRDVEISDLFLQGDSKAAIGIKIEHGLVGAAWTRQSYNNRLSRLRIWNCITHGLWLIGAQNNIVDDIDMLWSYGYGLRVECGDDTLSQFNNFNKLYIATDGNAALYFQGVAYSTVKNSYLYADTGAQDVTRLMHIVNCTSLTFEDSTFENVTSVGTEDTLIEVNSTLEPLTVISAYTNFNFIRCQWTSVAKNIDHVRINSNTAKIPTKLKFAFCDFVGPGTGYSINNIKGQDLYFENSWSINPYQSAVLYDITVYSLNNPSNYRIHKIIDAVEFYDADSDTNDVF